MRVLLLGLGVCLTGCTATLDLQEQSAAVTQPIPMRSGEYRGRYIVPAPANLTSAATFRVSQVEWTVAAGIATLHYELPMGLVGGRLPITVSGPIRPGATSVTLTSPLGTGWCQAQGTKVTCGEEFWDLGNLPMNSAVIMQQALADSISPSNRLAIANLFSSDPIGSVDFDLSTPADDDDDDDHGGHGPGGGGRH